MGVLLSDSIATVDKWHHLMSECSLFLFCGNSGDAFLFTEGNYSWCLCISADLLYLFGMLYFCMYFYVVLTLVNVAGSLYIAFVRLCYGQGINSSYWFKPNLINKVVQMTCIVANLCFLPFQLLFYSCIFKEEVLLIV